jgi:putative oxidoreductase
MDKFDSSYFVWAQRLLSVMRIIVAFLFIQHGAQKLFGFLAGASSSGPAVFSLPGVAGILEFFGGLLILLGLFTRPVAFINLSRLRRTQSWPLLKSSQPGQVAVHFSEEAI